MGCAGEEVQIGTALLHCWQQDEMGTDAGWPGADPDASLSSPRASEYTPGSQALIGCEGSEEKQDEAHEPECSHV